MPEKVSKSIQNISKLFDENADLETIRTRLNVLNLTSVDLDIIESLLIQLFGGNHRSSVLFIR